MGTPHKTNDEDSVGVDQGVICAAQSHKVRRTLIGLFYPGLTLEDIEEITQESALRYWRAQGRGEIRNALAYMKQTAKRLAWKHLQAKRDRRSTTSDPHDLDLNANDEGDALSEAEVNELVDHVREAIQQLPDNQRRAIAGYFEIAGALPCEDDVALGDLAAQALGMTPGQLRGNLFRGIKTLRKKLRHLWEDGPD